MEGSVTNGSLQMQVCPCSRAWAVPAEGKSRALLQLEADLPPGVTLWPGAQAAAS